MLRKTKIKETSNFTSEILAVETVLMRLINFAARATGEYAPVGDVSR